MAGARTDNQRTTTERYRAPCGIEVITYAGNIIGIQDATAAVTGEGVGFKQKSQITKALIESNCCPDFERVRDKVIKNNEGLKAWEVRTSKLDCESKFTFIFHVLMKTQENEYWIEGMKKMYERLFKKVEKNEVSILALPLLGSGRAGADISDAVRAVTESITLLRDHDHRHLRKIYLATMDTQYADTMATYCQLYFQNCSLAKQKRMANVRYLLGLGGPKYGGKASKSPVAVNRSKALLFPRSDRDRQQHETTDPSLYKTFEYQSQPTLNEPERVQQSRDGQKTFQRDKTHLEEKQNQQPKHSQNEIGHRQQEDIHMHKDRYGYQTHTGKFPEGRCIREQPILAHRHDENDDDYDKKEKNESGKILHDVQTQNYDRTRDFLSPLVLESFSGKPLISFDQDIVDPPDVPPTWSQSSKDTELVTLLPESAEFQEVQHSFLRSIGSLTYNVIQIVRVQSTIQWNHFKLSMEQIVQRNPDISCERLLWHGTSAKSITYICKEGFNRSFCGKNAVRYGEGTYFSRNSSYAAEDTYSVPDDDGIKYVFRARVLTGRYTKGQSGMKVPPYLNVKESTRFDSVVDNVDKPNLFVIFHDHKAYPEYLIKFS